MQTADDIRQNTKQVSDNNINGKVTFEQGQEYTIVNEEGEPVKVIVTANESGVIDNGDGTINVSDGQEVMPVAKDVIQQQVDAVNIARIAEKEAKRQALNEAVKAEEQKEEQTESRQATRPELQINDELTLTDEEGNIFKAGIEEITPDGVVISVENPDNGLWRTHELSNEELNNRVVDVTRDGNVLWERPVAPVENAPIENVERTTDSGRRTNGNSEQSKLGKTVDIQGNPLNEDGSLKVEKVSSVDDLTDEDFSNPTRNVQLPALPAKVDAAIGANGKPVVIKKNIFEKNSTNHKFSPEESRHILQSALYDTDFAGRTQPT